MSIEAATNTSNGDSRHPKTGEFYILRPDMRGPDGHGVVFENEDTLTGPARGILRPEAGGFPPMKETPRLRHHKSKGPLPNDLDADFSGYWLVSELLKKLFESVDPDAFAFAPVDFILDDGSIGPAHYLCDVTRVINALDEKLSRLKIKHGDYVNGKFYSLALEEGASLAFKKEILGSSHIFLTPYSPEVFCDRVMRDALIANGFGVEPETRGVWLEDVFLC